MAFIKAHKISIIAMTLSVVALAIISAAIYHNRDNIRTRLKSKECYNNFQILKKAEKKVNTTQKDLNKLNEKENEIYEEAKRNEAEKSSTRSLIRKLRELGNQQTTLKNNLEVQTQQAAAARENFQKSF